VAAKVPVLGLYSSALEMVVPFVLMPPATSTVPVERSWAEWPFRAVARAPARKGVKVI